MTIEPTLHRRRSEAIRHNLPLEQNPPRPAAGDARRALTLFQQSLGAFRDQADQRGIAESLIGLASALRVLGQSARAVQLFGAANALLEASGAALWPANRPEYDRSVALARNQLGATDFATAWVAGRVLTPDGAIADALSEDLAPELTVTEALKHPTSAQGSALTAREREVARLVARGLTNRQIGEALVITTGTAGLHVKNILGKLGFSSRAQIAAWAVEHRLAPRSPESPEVDRSGRA